ncbi:MAG: hypothetical protein ACREBS_07080 [Nitrososphaerales archaeon]
MYLQPSEDWMKSVVFQPKSGWVNFSHYAETPSIEILNAANPKTSYVHEFLAQLPSKSPISPEFQICNRKI